ncbi:MAG: hypothetical protein HMLKMBBP_01439 [Planctomycetes bacterium]|nr:hypothetical protein [Planctomycetota bacterium]
MTSVLLAQDRGPPAMPHQEANEGFFGWGPVLLLLFVVGGTMAWAIWRARRRPSTLPRFDDGSFQAEVLENRMPVLVHFARHWNVANAAAVSQTELLAWKNRGAVLVGMLEIDECPRTMDRFPGLEPPAYVLFYRGRKLFHRPGLIQADDLQAEIDVALSREGF